MPKQDFTPDGLATKLTELYALSDASLTTQAEAMASDFSTFMTDNFNFTTSEGSYLSGMTATAALVFGWQLAAVLLVRGPITMDDLPDNPEPPRPKEIKITLDGHLSYSNGTPGGLESTLSASISWTLL